MSDHVHVLFQLSKNHALSKVIGGVKGESSKWLKDTFPKLCDFSWQGGYGAFSVSASHLDSVCDYIARQPEHHLKRTFQDEFRAFLAKYNVEYEEKYVWN